MKVRMLRTLAVLLLLAMALSMFPLMTTAAEEKTQLRDAAQVQYLTDPIFPSRNYGGQSTVNCTENYTVYCPDGVHIGLYDNFGKVIIPVSDYIGVINLNGWLIALRRGSDYKYALFQGTVRLTDFAYTSVKKDGIYIRCEKDDGKLDYYDMNARPVALPKIPSDASLVSVVGTEAAIISQPNYDVLLDQQPTKKYALCDWNGNILFQGFGRKELVKVNEKIIRVETYADSSYIDTKGEYLLGNERMFLCISPDQKTFAVSYDGNYTMLDDNLQARWTINASSFTFLTNDSVLAKLTDGNCVLLSLGGRELLRTPCDTLTVSDYVSDPISPRDYYVGTPELLGFAVQKGDNATLYNLKGQVLCALADVKSVSVGDTYFFVTYLDGNKSCYSRDGELLFTFGADRSIFTASGILLEAVDRNYAICNTKGERITDVIYDFYSDTGAYGILQMYLLGNSEQYLVNSNAEVLNSHSLKIPVRFYCSVTDYRIGNEFGIIRYVGVNDSSFMDVPSNAWYLDEVEYCYESGLFSGTDVGRFSPEAPMTRAMLVTVLWRLEGSPNPNAPAEFSDVKQGIWYSDAVAWAAENGIVNGVGKGKFDPDGSITREQMATIIYRYGKWKNYEMSAAADLSEYPDASSVSGYAVEALSWANGAGIITGSAEGGVRYLQPQGQASRAQVAAILMRFIENIIE